MFSCEFCEIFKKTYFYKTPPVAGSYPDIIYDKPSNINIYNII